LQLDKAIFPTIYIGAEASMGYHYMLSGDDIVGEAKTQAINQAIEENNIPESIAAELRTAVGAESIDSKDLNGTNYNFGAYIKVDL
jgi:Rps23 Pro-64 3,4-dihydroxylase Tpa1-like proline 4-hydroxylase